MTALTEAKRAALANAVCRKAVQVLGKETAHQWMRQPNAALGNVAPCDMIDSVAGAVAVRQILNAIATGGVV